MNGFFNRTTATTAPTVAELQELMRTALKPPPRKVIVTPSLEALEAAIGQPVTRVEFDGTLPLHGGIRVVIDKAAPRPMLVPAEVVDGPTPDLTIRRGPGVV